MDEYLTLDVDRKMRILTERLAELEAEHFRLGVIGEESLEVGDMDSASSILRTRQDLDKGMAVVRQRMEDLNPQPREVDNDRAPGAERAAS